MTSDKKIAIDRKYWELLQEENKLLKEKLNIQVQLSECMFKLNKNKREQEERIEEYINNYRTGWIRLFPENPELEDVFIN